MNGMNDIELVISQIASTEELGFNHSLQVNPLNLNLNLNSNSTVLNVLNPVDDAHDQLQSLKQMYFLITSYDSRAYSSHIPFEKHTAKKKKEKKKKKSCKKGDQRRKSPYNLFLSYRMKEEREKDKSIDILFA